MRIDAHQHFWNFNPSRDTWIDNSMLVLQNNFLPKDLKPLLKANNFDGCIAVQADQSIEETKFLLDLADKNSFIKGVVGWVNLCDKNIKSTLKTLSKHPKLKGVRHIVQPEPDGYMLQDSFLNGIAHLENHNLTYDILISAAQLSDAIEMVKQFPNQKFILDHIAKPSIKEKKINSWQTAITKLASYKNVHCKLSGLVTEANWLSWKTNDFEPYLDVVFKVFGIEKLVFATDWPVCLLASNYKNVVAIIENYIKNLTPEEQKAIMGNNALKFYNI